MYSWIGLVFMSAVPGSLINNINHMRISGTELSSAILRQTK